MIFWVMISKLSVTLIALSSGIKKTPSVYINIDGVLSFPKLSVYRITNKPYRLQIFPDDTATKGIAHMGICTCM